MTLDRTPMNAPAVPAHKPGQCSAFGCPMWAGIKIGSDWVCDCHAFADMAEWQHVTQRLNQRVKLVRATHRAMNTDPFKGWSHAAGVYMPKIGHPDLAPRRVTLAHPYKDRHTGEEVERNVERDEGEHLPLWVNRLRSALFRECTGGIPQPQQPETRAAATGPQTVASMLPEFEHV
ncbi:hypothetical protein [Cupriavidus campinensis]|uniref:hypothetical protein n=1 Tax=Cupriavidus campinensis TaxID=151783 RepID=UPI0024E22A5E|nr:hypothetical protein [Cupriavidus campinensis]